MESSKRRRALPPAVDAAPQDEGKPYLAPGTVAARRPPPVLRSPPVLEVDIPHAGRLRLEHLVCDVNGTLATDGEPQPEVVDLLAALRQRLQVHLLTSDTHNRQDDLDRLLGIPAVRIPPGRAAAPAKARYLAALGPDRCVAVGNGRNDRLMLRRARLAIVVLGAEGAAAEALRVADVVVPAGADALRLLLLPARLVATLRG